MIPQRLPPRSHRVHAAVFLVLALGWAARADADITRIVITHVESPTFEGVSFGQVGQYEKLRLRAFGEVDPNMTKAEASILIGGLDNYDED